MERKSILAASKLRLVFVADEFPPELRRIVEFLNRQMHQTDVFAVEVRQFVSPDGTHRTLVPRLVGKVEGKSSTAAGSGSGPRWDRSRFVEALGSANQLLVPALDELVRFGTELTGRDPEWGRGRDRGSITMRLVENGLRISAFTVYSTAEVSVNFGWFFESLERVAPAFSEKIRDRTNELFAQTFSRNTWEKGWPMIPLSLVASDIAEFEDFVSRCVGELKSLLNAGA